MDKHNPRAVCEIQLPTGEVEARDEVVTVVVVFVLVVLVAILRM